MVFETTVVLPDYDPDARTKAIEFWEQRGVVFKQKEGVELRGRRGGLLENLSTFDMSRLRTNVRLRSVDDRTIACTVEVNTLFQIITDYNHVFWLLELRTFESWLRHGDLRLSAWRRYRDLAKKSDLKWILTMGASSGERKDTLLARCIGEEYSLLRPAAEGQSEEMLLRSATAEGDFHLLRPAAEERVTERASGAVHRDMEGDEGEAGQVSHGSRR